VIQERRVAKLVELGILEAGAAVSPRPGHIPAWDDMPAELQDWESRRMAGYAAMIDLASQHPERVAKMAGEWHRMTRDVLIAPEREQRPVATEDKPKIHPQWSNYDPEPGRHTGNR